MWFLGLVEYIYQQSRRRCCTGLWGLPDISDLVAGMGEWDFWCTGIGGYIHKNITYSFLSKYNLRLRLSELGIEMKEKRGWNRETERERECKTLTLKLHRRGSRLWGWQLPNTDRANTWKSWRPHEWEYSNLLFCMFHILRNRFGWKIQPLLFWHPVKVLYSIRTDVHNYCSECKTCPPVSHCTTLKHNILAKLLRSYIAYSQPFFNNWISLRIVVVLWYMIFMTLLPVIIILCLITLCTNFLVQSSIFTWYIQTCTYNT